MKLTNYFKALGIVQSISQVHKSAAISFDNVEDAVDALQGWYNSTYGLWVPSTGCANCLTTLANLASIDSTVNQQLGGLWNDVFIKAPKFNALMTQNFGPHWTRKAHDDIEFAVQDQAWWQRSKYKDVRFLNDYYDDEGWWALAWIAIYDLTQTPKYLEEAQIIFDDMHAAFGTTPLGGIWWDKKKTYVNAIANELYFSVAAHLANRCPERKSLYVTYATRSWNWIFNSGLINDRNNIVDGLNISIWNPNMSKVWSYNQGVVLGALVELSQATDQPTYIDIAITIADAALFNLTGLTHPSMPNLILHEICEPDCGMDGPSFKGIFARNLAKLYSVSHIALYADFLMKNAEAIWQKDRHTKTNRLGLIWGGPLVLPMTAATQCSAMDALVGSLTRVGEWSEYKALIAGNSSAKTLLTTDKG